MFLRLSATIRIVLGGCSHEASAKPYAIQNFSFKSYRKIGRIRTEVSRNRGKQSRHDSITQRMDRKAGLPYQTTSDSPNPWRMCPPCAAPLLRVRRHAWG